MWYSERFVWLNASESTPSDSVWIECELRIRQCCGVLWSYHLQGSITVDRELLSVYLQLCARIIISPSVRAAALITRLSLAPWLIMTTGSRSAWVCALEPCGWCRMCWHSSCSDAAVCHASLCLTGATESLYSLNTKLRCTTQCDKTWTSYFSFFVLRFHISHIVLEAEFWNSSTWPVISPHVFSPLYLFYFMASVGYEIMLWISEVHQRMPTHAVC